MWPVLYSLSTVPNVPGISRLQRDMDQWTNAYCKHLTIIASSKKERKEEKATYRVNMFAIPRWLLSASHWSHRLTGHSVHSWQATSTTTWLAFFQESGGPRRPTTATAPTPPCPTPSWPSPWTCRTSTLPTERKEAAVSFPVASEQSSG